jgi:hypothetical protein
MTNRGLLRSAGLCLLVWGGSVRAFTNAPVRELGLFKVYSDSAEIFDKTVRLADCDKGPGYFLQHTIEACRSNAALQGRSPQSIANMAGHWLEWAVLVALKQSHLTPAYLQAQFNAVPNAYNDVLLWSKEHGPVIISCKTSLRERYKQADLEAVALRVRFPNARFYLVTLDADKKHVARVRRKIKEGEIVALHAVYDETNMTELFTFLKTLAFSEPPDGTLRSGKMVH